ncbi:MAG TPA: hypothetical protein PKE45_18840, partial [Caldilineaceae bacterium]|nr:hypothetical protein [Caldilineaceae bacterium]
TRKGEMALAHTTYEQALATARANQDRAGTAFILTAVGELARQEGDYARAAAYYDEAMTLARTLGQKARVMMLLHNQGYVALQRDEAGHAAATFRACLKLGLELPDKENFGMCLIGLGCVAIVEGQTPRAIRLFAAGARTLADLGADLVPADQMEFDRYLALARERMPAERFARLWAEGQALAPEQAQALALA